MTRKPGKKARKSAEEKREAQLAKQPVPSAKAKKVNATPAPALAGGKAAAAADEAFRNKEKVLVLASRGITHRYRHLMGDVCELLPHMKKEPKLDTKTRKHKDLYLWMAKTPSGPSIKFHILNVHTLAELKLTGNHLKGARPILSFDATFDNHPHLQVMKELLAQVFGTPKNHRKSKPFVDHTMSFTVADNRVWIRNYQIVLPPTKKGNQAVEGMSLVEVGPRLCLNPIRIFAGSFRGQVLYDNPEYVSPNHIRAAEKRKFGAKYESKVKSKAKRSSHLQTFAPAPGELDGVWDGDGGDEDDDDMGDSD